MTDQKSRLNEFREASAALRHAFTANAETREAQILANLNHAASSRKLSQAQERLELADRALQAEQADVEAQVFDSATPPVPFATKPNGVVIEADPAAMGIG